MPTHANRYQAQTQGLIRRLLALTDLLRSRRYGLTRFQIYDALPDEYAGEDAAKERKFHRDMAMLRGLERVVVINAGGTITGGEAAVYIAPENAHYRREEVDRAP